MLRSGGAERMIACARRMPAIRNQLQVVKALNWGRPDPITVQQEQAKLALLQANLHSCCMKNHYSCCYGKVEFSIY